MSDDIPIIFAHDLCTPHGAPPPAAVFASAVSPPQMQQYAAGGWRVLTGPAFRAATNFDLKTVPATAASAGDLASPALVSCELAFWSDADAAALGGWSPEVIKVNAAFQDADAAKAESCVKALAGLGYQVLGAHWRNDNSFGIRIFSYIDRIASFEPPEWNRLNIIAVRRAETARAILSIGRLYVGEERRIGELRVAQSIRNDHIARLEDALRVLQQSK